MKPILFNTEMVRAILDGRKMVTRRVIKPQPKSRLAYIYKGCHQGEWGYPDELDLEYLGKEFCLPETLTEEDSKKYWIPPYHVGDILYVRETWRIVDYLDNASLQFEYLADGKVSDFIDFTNLRLKKFLKYISNKKWCPSLFMPKEAARLFLWVTDVRVERLQDITEEQAKAEGVTKAFDYNTPEGSVITLDEDGYFYFGFKAVWNSTIKKSDLGKYGWAANPWAWVIEFERISKEEALKGGAE